MSHDSLPKELSEVLWYDEALEKSSFSYFSEQLSFLSNIGPIWLKITQPTALEVFRNVLA